MQKNIQKKFFFLTEFHMKWLHQSVPIKDRKFVIGIQCFSKQS